MIGILSADIDGPFHQHAFTDLMNEAQLQAPQPERNDENKLPQVHALNCLKDLFMCASIPSNAYITSALKIAAASISSQMWDIQNLAILTLELLTPL